ncbi:MAG: carboxypeptidase regulatory-like domain-containing protein [Acidobacteria bacterium]|nr:carboxypeptidase regulatory-like domain-containing protein [Acidobacteriota bacterium]MBV9477712.1 carboxypeptidase regulatory-like domain-containing protein [Acidobacteriota bacterium]
MKLIAALLLLFSTTLLAQTTASLSGAVTAGGAPLAGVEVAIASPALQGMRTTTTGEAGVYHFAALPPGAYTVRFTRGGFQQAALVVTLRLSQPARADAAMQPAAGESIIVTASAPAVLESPQVSTNLPFAEVERLPVQRNQLATAQLAPGVTVNGVSNGQLQISGGPGYDNLVLVNGVTVTENTRGQIRPMYVEDAIQETTVLTGAISAEYGRFSGGVVSTITKAGGNDFTGSLRDSLSSPAWSAQTPAREAREGPLSHVWEGTLGGFMLRDRLWFFGAGRWAKNDTARQTVAIPAFANPASAAGPAFSYNEGNDQKRFEGKLTAQVTPRHSVAASYFKIDTHGTDVRFNNNIYDEASLTTRDDPESLLAAHYEGMFAANAMSEAYYSGRKFSDRTGGFATDLAGGTVLLDRSNNNTRFNAPTLCGACDAEHRDNADVLLRGHVFFDGGRAGAHDLVAGVDRFTERRYANNHQSASDFSLFVTRVQYADGVIYPVVTPSNANGGGSFIRWNPVLVAANDDELRTDSAFLNDVWSAGRWQFSGGLRWDRNHAVDADGAVAADDRKLSPRLGIQYDLHGNGRQRVSASYAEYVSRIADSIASSNQAAGNAAAIDFAYRGPAINDRALTTPLADVIRMVFDFFNTTQGGTANRAPNNLRANGVRTIPGYTSYFDGTLASPSVREVTLGYGAELGSSGYVRADAIARDWRDFYASSVTTATSHTDTPLGIPVDLALLRNSNHVRRQYRAVQLQARWSPRRFDTGVFYTLATLRGNDESDNPANGAVPNVDPSLYYPEFFAYDRAAPVGNLPGDERHRMRAWAGYTFDLRPVLLSASVLQSYDSALPYSIAAPINLTRYNGAPANPGYATVPNGVYYFSGRGALRVDDIQSTDLALRASLRFGALEWFAQGDLLNAFNRDGVADPQRISTTVNTAANSTAFAPFDPARQTPVACPQGAAASVCTAMGANYQLAANFGQPLNDLAYQRPRTLRLSLGFRF